MTWFEFPELPRRVLSVVWHALAAEKDSPGRQRAAITYWSGGSHDPSDSAGCPDRDAGVAGDRVRSRKLVLNKVSPGAAQTAQGSDPGGTRNATHDD